MKKFSLKYLYLIFSIITFLYLCVCIVFLRFSISVFIYFLAASLLLLALYYVETHKIDKHENEPNPIHIFIKVSSLVFFGITLLLLLFNLLYPKHKLENGYDYIIVFGAGIGDKNEIMNSRIDNAADFARKYKTCKFVLTGAKGSDEPIEEAYYMKDYMVKKGIAEDRIITEPFSVNTSENIINSLELIKIDIKKRNAKEHIITRPFLSKKGVFDLDFLNIGFMSSDFHMTRIVMMAKKQGIVNPFVLPCATKKLYLPYMYVKENLSLFKAIVLNQLRL